MKNNTDAGFDQHYNVQVAVDQESLLISSLRIRSGIAFCHDGEYLG
jgi:hypothetical protein